MTARYYTFPDYCRKTFGRKLWRVPLDIGCTCPNRDGTLGASGCIFCSEGSGDFSVAYDGSTPDRSRLALFEGKDNIYGNAIAYFQSYTNTYGDPVHLEKMFSAALEDPLFAAVSIATRPDCLPEEMLQLLSSLKERYPLKPVWIELGLQSVHSASAFWMRRGYELEVFDDCVRRLKRSGFPVIVHVILGLPGEGEEEVLATIHHLNELRIDGIKLQLLHILAGTDLAREYKEGKVLPLSEEEYIHLVCACIANLDPGIVIHRLSGDGNREKLLAPLWSIRKRQVLNRIEHALKVQGIYQGSAL